MDFNFSNFLHNAELLRQDQRASREAKSKEEETAKILTLRSDDKLMQQLVRLEYNEDSQLYGHKVQLERNGKWQFTKSSGPGMVFVTGFGIDELQGAYLVGLQPGRFGDWRIFIDGLTGLDIIDLSEIAQLQPQPG